MTTETIISMIEKMNQFEILLNQIEKTLNRLEVTV